MQARGPIFAHRLEMDPFHRKPETPGEAAMKYSDEALMLKISSSANRGRLRSRLAFTVTARGVLQSACHASLLLKPLCDLVCLLPSCCLPAFYYLSLGPGKKLREYLGQWEASLGSTLKSRQARSGLRFASCILWCHTNHTTSSLRRYRFVIS